jgi:hypothetical protein
MSVYGNNDFEYLCCWLEEREMTQPSTLMFLINVSRAKVKELYEVADTIKDPEARTWWLNEFKSDLEEHLWFQTYAWEMLLAWLDQGQWEIPDVYVPGRVEKTPYSTTYITGYWANYQGVPRDRNLQTKTVRRKR